MPAHQVATLNIIKDTNQINFVAPLQKKLAVTH